MSEATRVTCSVGYTKNMENFESLRIDFGVSDSVREKESVGSATERVYEFVSNKLLEKIIELQEEVTEVKATKTKG